jgi:uncharacterized alkaline shock family protein YloU
MAALTHAQEYQAVREAIQTLTGTGASKVSVSVDGISVTYNASQMTQLAAREIELKRRLSQRNIRKRTIGDFS